MQIGLLVEDHRDARIWLSETMLGAFPGIKLSTSEDLKTARTTLSHMCDAGIHPDVALIDLGLPDGTGVELIRKLQTCAPDCVCVVASRYDDDEHLFDALHAGARGYL